MMMGIESDSAEVIEMINHGGGAPSMCVDSIQIVQAILVIQL